MMRKRVWSGVLISAMAVSLAASSVPAAEAGTEDGSSVWLSELSDEGTDGESPDAEDLSADPEEDLPEGSEEAAGMTEAEDAAGSAADSSAGDLSDEALPKEEDGDGSQSEEGAPMALAALKTTSDDASEEEETEESEEEEAVAELATKADPSISDGFHQDPDSGDWYYYTDGAIDTGKNSVIKGTVDGVSDWWYVVGGKVQLTFTGLADYSNSSGWWYITKGKVDRTYTGLAKNKNGWYYVTSGRVDKSYTGFATNANGSWYVESGKLTRSKNGVIKDTKGTLGTAGEWYYVVGSEVRYDYTGLADYKNSSGWWYITKGKVDKSYTGLAKNKNGWYYVKNGKVDKSYTGFAKNANGSWYLESGKLTRSKNGVIKDAKGTLGTKGEWYYVLSSKVQSDFTGLADYSNASGWWYITNGKVDRTVNTVAKNKYGWYYVLGGKVQKNFTGLADYKNASGWWYITKGKVDRTVTTIAKNKNGTYYVQNGKVQQGFSGTVTIDGETYSVTNGKATLVESGTELPDDYEFTLSPEDISYAGKDTTQLATPVFSGIVDGNNGTMTLTWEAVPGAEKYRVFRKAYGDSSWTKLGDTASTSYTDHLWNESKLYYYTVRCVSADGSEYMSDYINGFSGSAVANYAKQFVGNPYVYGGTSLTNGCDCSGFVMQVYAHFGVYLPHSSTVQITLGKAVTYDTAQPGDIVGRSGHTAIYIGNGQIVHAQDSQHGICISESKPSSYPSIRRIF